MSHDLPARTGPQFQTAPGGLSNLDRCNWCGAPRSAHGIDWTCPSGPTATGKPFVVFVIAAGLVTLLGIALLTATSATATSLGTLGASCTLAGITLLVCGATIAARRR